MKTEYFVHCSYILTRGWVRSFDTLKEAHNYYRDYIINTPLADYCSIERVSYTIINGKHAEFHYRKTLCEWGE